MINFNLFANSASGSLLLFTDMTGYLISDEKIHLTQKNNENEIAFEKRREKEKEKKQLIEVGREILNQN